MKINELLAEEQNNEGIGSFLGKGVGAVAQGVGAVAGAIPGAWERMKKGYAAGKATVAGDDETATDTTGGTPPAASGGTPPASTPGASKPSLTDPSSIGGGAPAPSGTTAPAPASTPAPAPASTPAPSGSTTPPAGGEPPATPAADQASKVGVGQINKLIPALRTRDLQSVKKTVDATIAKKTAGKQPAGQAPAAGTADSGAMANMANQLSGNKPNTMANAPVSKTNKAKPGNPNAAPAAPTQAELDADNERMATGTNENKIVRFESRFLGMMI